MPKYYVDSADLKFVCHAPNHVDALQKALSGCSSETRLAAVIRVNEQGFDRTISHESDHFFHTGNLLMALGIGFE